MKSIKSVYKIGNGPSSSHTVGPYHAAQTFGERYPDADSYEVTLYGSLAFTGEGHGTGKAILEGLPGASIVFDRETTDLPHPNTMKFRAFKNGEEIASVRIFSIGGGSIRIENEASEEDKDVYPQNSFSEIVSLCNQERISIIQLIYILEGYQLRDYLKTVWKAMRSAVERGLKAKGILPGGLKLTDMVLNSPDGRTFEQVLAEYVPWAGGANPSVASNEFFKGGETWPVCLEAVEGLRNFFPETVWAPFSRYYTTEESSELASIKPEQEQYWKEWRGYFITGQKDVNDDATWAEYVAGFAGVKNPRYMEIYNKGYEAWKVENAAA
jgi:hypothetical protein